MGDEESDSEVLIEQGKSLQKVVEESGRIMDENELQGFYRKCLSHLQESEVRKQLTETHKEDDFHVQVAEIIGALFNSHGEATIPIAKDLYENFIIKSLQPNMNHKMHKFGLFLICDIIDHLGNLLEQDLVNTFYEALHKYATDPIVFVRHAAVYGLGQLALRLKGNFMPR